MAAMGVAIFAYIFVINATWTCNYFQIDGYLTATSPYYADADGERRGVGLFSYESIDPNTGAWVCYRYSRDQLQGSGFLDGPFKAAMAMGIIANICIGVTMILMLAIGCVSFTPVGLKVAGYACLFGSFCMLMTFVAFGSDLTNSPYNGTFHTGAGVAIGAVILSLITGVLVVMLPPATDPFEGEPAPRPFEPGTETVTETKMPDGTKKITKTRVNPDGSQTVEETVIRPNP